MKLTALDIHHKEFRHSLRGYSEEEVDGFLDQVADEFDRLFKENIDLAERLEQANERVRGYQSMEATLNNTLVSAQRSAEEIQNKAGIEADAMLRDAELKAKEIIHNALQRKQARDRGLPNHVPRVDFRKRDMIPWLALSKRLCRKKIKKRLVERMDHARETGLRDGAEALQELALIIEREPGIVRIGAGNLKDLVARHPGLGESGNVIFQEELNESFV